MPDRAVCIKATEAEQVALFVAYPAMKADVAKAKDGRRDFAQPGVVEKAAWNWLAKGGKLSLLHHTGQAPKDQFEVVESGIHRGPDWVIKALDGTTQTIREGDWLCAIRALSKEAWEVLKAVGGLSPEGSCWVNHTPDPSVLAQLRS